MSSPSFHRVETGSQPRPDEFKPPPECPVFEPSWEEFRDPYAFINKIRPIAEKTGICKVRPPPDWQPPFACDVDKLHFVPRIQRLNELEAQTRVKLNFLDKIAKFWDLQGCSLKIPHVERKILDLYKLYKLVADEGGFEIVCQDRRWTKIALQMGYSPGKAIGSHLRGHYERILYPYTLFQNGANLLCVQKPVLQEETVDNKEHKLQEQAQRLPTPMTDTCPSARRAKRMKCEVRTSHIRVLLCSPHASCNVTFYVVSSAHQFHLDTKKLVCVFCYFVVQVDLVVCLVCASGGDEDRLLLCDGCDDSYHTYCLIPPLHDVPRGDWRCPKCLAQECSKPHEAFGFEQASRDYSLRAFGQMADAFKSDYFNMPVHMVPTELVEKEFWRLVGAIDEDVTVEYGADIASKEFGSGFPIPNGKFKVSPADEKYLKCGWNLNNLAMMNPSVLTHVTADICGMTLPWLYVGMCFSSFCWHIEDHWSYSINYLHWGEPKTWYGAPGFAAEQLESVMKKLAPELFESQPDLLHQLVTIMNPNTLMAYGVPIYRTNQCAGEFVITFPRAYHSGFNQGFNFAEAVNFCTVDWMPLGRQCVDHYRMLHRYNVFSHDEMVCNMATKADTLNMVLASAVHKDMVFMIQEERELREKAKKMAKYDHLQDDERQCAKCRTTCYLSAITCPCSPGVLVCLYHIGDLCSCPVTNYTLNYRYTLDELYPMMTAVKQRAELYDEWACRVTETLEAKLEKKKGEEQTSRKRIQQRVGLFHFGDLPASLSEKVLAEESPSVAEIQSLLDVSFDFDVDLPELPKLRVRLEQARWLEAVQQAATQPATLTLETMRMLIDQGVGLAPHSSVEKSMARLQEQLTMSEHWEDKASSLLKARPPHSIETLSAAAEKASGIPAYLPNCLLLKDTIRKASEWLQEADELQSSGCVLMVDSLSDMVLRGQAIQVHLEPLDQLETLLAAVQEWKESAAAAFLQKDLTKNLLEVSPSLKWKSDVEKSLLGTKDPTSVATLEELRVREMETFYNLRAANESKLLPTADCMDLKVCFCQKAPMGAMLQCELCRDAFHSVCVRDSSGSCDTQPWLCPHCQRSEKLPLSKVLSLLESLQRIGVRLPEGDALGYLVERTHNWQERAQQVLCKLPELEERPRTPPTLTHWVSGCENDPKNTQVIDIVFLDTSYYPELEGLMVEGLLLQVCLPQVQSLYHFLLDRASSQQAKRCRSPLLEEPTDRDKHMQFISQGTNVSLNQVRQCRGNKLAPSGGFVCNGLIWCFRMVPAAPKKLLLRGK
uniref:[histone H3]-trimethyl-L-lysine(4) demethylase n=1 Tax=Oryzias sinensis TaxID=183150 RepID=A0A8C7ZZX7_9TELE